MDRPTTLALNAINRDFYRHHADEFGRTRRAPWAGWRRVLQCAREFQRTAPPRSLLDVGCGNGRFGRFVAAQTCRAVSYVGIDSSTRALEQARSALAGIDSVTLIEQDIVRGEGGGHLPQQLQRRFAMVSAFGVLHHIPGRDLRAALVAELARCLAPRGVLALSLWRFARFERFQRKMQACDEVLRQYGGRVDQLEPGDYLLPWGAAPTALRYCHCVDPEETATWLAAEPQLQRLDAFTADGHTDNLNQYHVLGLA